jgi:phage antirepressor YoqD-like protein
MQNPSQLLKIEQLAEVLEISEWTLRAMVKRQQIPHCYLGERKNKLRFNLIELSEFFQVKEGGAA